MPSLFSGAFADLLRCPVTQERLHLHDDRLVAGSGERTYRIDELGIPLFAETAISEAGKAQQRHYDRVAQSYVTNLGYPHTQEYLAYLDEHLRAVIGRRSLGVTAELCCGRGEAAHLLGSDMVSYVGVDVSSRMLAAARRDLPSPRFVFVQGDCTRLPLAASSFDTVVMLGGIHHVQDRQRLFREICRILKPDGWFYWREPVSDFFLWRWIRAVIYRVSPALDHDTESPLRRQDTVPPLVEAGFLMETWKTFGAVGFCLFMNSDVLVFNRLFRFMPGIRSLTRAFVRLDDRITRSRLFDGQGLIVIGAARKLAR